MTSPRRGTRGETPPRGPAARDPGASPPLSGPRRIGVLVVVGALVASVLMAVGGGSGRPTAPAATPSPPPTAAPTPTPSPSPVGPPPTVAPVIAPPESELLTVREVALTVTIPEPGVPLRTLELRIYRGARQLVDPVRVRQLTQTIRRIPLRRGENRITAVLANAGGEGPRSEVLLITVDDQAPRIELRGPDEGAVINGSIATVRGVTEPGLTVSVRNPSVGAALSPVADDRGVFAAEVRLGSETNRLEVETQDAAGNRTRLTRTVVRGDAVPEAKLTMSRSSLRLGQLPMSVNIVLELLDPEGRPVNGVTVFFSISPPGLATQIFETETVEGTARWDDVVLVREGAVKGNGFVTVRAELGPGVPPALATKPFVIR